MSISPAEFERSVAALGGPVERIDAGAGRLVLRFALAAGSASVRFEPMTPLTIAGSLLSLPRGEVAIAFDGADETAAKAFLRRFEIAFQRGGG